LIRQQIFVALPLIRKALGLGLGLASCVLVNITAATHTFYTHKGAMVGACIDYCNSISHGASTSSITKLQRLQISLARVVLQQPIRTHAEPLLRSLHWLPVEHRVTYRLAVLTFNVRLTETPAYLNSLSSNRVTASRMSIRSSTRPLMAAPRTNTVCASRSFSVCAPVVWNSLPPEIQSCSLAA